MHINVPRKLTPKEEIENLKKDVWQKEQELEILNSRLEATEEALLTLMFGGEE